MSAIEFLADVIPGDPVYGIVVIGTITYLCYVLVAGGKTDIRKKVKALKGDLTISFIIVVATAILARYFIHISSRDYFLLPDILSVIVAFALYSRVRQFYGLS